MRLINVNTFELVEFTEAGRGDQAYAILSHTWGQDEVTYKDMQSTSCRQKAGWKKIEYTCAEARRRRLKWAWVDTCCIDKSSSAELTESINSMYKWYEQASVCLVYLEDVVAEEMERDANRFTSSRWFKRGWTLQELLAPSQVEFHDISWTPVGTRGSLAHHISTVTLINQDIGMLQDKNKNNRHRISRCSIAMRMSWASSRETTRIEDIAYCLMGIFNVNMPLLYGEGERAFFRLQEEIMKASDDHSILAWGLERKEFGVPNELRPGVDFLADHPCRFQSCEDIIAIKSGSHSMTSQGLQITVPIFSTTESGPFYEIFHAVLGCYSRSQTENSFIVLSLRLIGSRSDFANNTYIRVSSFGVRFASFRYCCSATEKTILISPGGSSQRRQLLRKSGESGMIPWLCLKLPDQFEDQAVLISDGSSEVMVEKRRGENQDIWFSFEDSTIPTDIVVLIREKISGSLLWAFLEQVEDQTAFPPFAGTMYREGNQNMAHYGLDYVASRNRLNLRRLFSGLDLFPRLIPESDNRCTTVHKYTETFVHMWYIGLEFRISEMTDRDRRSIFSQQENKNAERYFSTCRS